MPRRRARKVPCQDPSPASADADIHESPHFCDPAVPTPSPSSACLSNIQQPTTGCNGARDTAVGGRVPSCVGTCQLEGERIEVSGFGCDADLEHLVASIRQRGEPSGPNEATVRVFRGDAIVAEGTFRPHYQIEEPNGPGCGEHVFASASLEVD